MRLLVADPNGGTRNSAKWVIIVNNGHNARNCPSLPVIARLCPLLPVFAVFVRYCPLLPVLALVLAQRAIGAVRAGVEAAR